MGAIETDVERARGFIRDLQRAEEVYRRLLDMTRDQSRILQGGLSPELLDLARSKEEEIRRLVDIETRMAPARSAWPDIRDRLSGDLRGEVQTVVARVEATLRELLQAEEEEGKSLASQRDETLAQIRRLDSARKVRGAYLEAPPARSLLDQKE